MIDIHCHPLPFLDDGARNWEAALEMARLALDDGITECIATPHWTGIPGEAGTVPARLAEFHERLEAARLPLQVHPGNEVILLPTLLDALREGEALTLAGTSYVLLETAQLERGPFVRPALFRLQSHGYRIILAHPERVPSWERDLSELRGLVEAGCYLQVNAQSLLGGFGRAARSAAERFLRLGWVSLLASDAHSPGSRPPLLTEARQACARIIGEEAARHLVETHPRRLLANQVLPYVDTDRETRRPRFSFPWARR